MAQQEPTQPQVCEDRSRTDPAWGASVAWGTTMTNENSKGGTPPAEGARSCGSTGAAEERAGTAEEVEALEFELPEAGACASTSSAWRLNRNHAAPEGSTFPAAPPVPPVARNSGRPSSVGALPVPRSALSRLSVGVRDGAGREGDGPVSPRPAGAPSAAGSADAAPAVPAGEDAEVTLTAPHATLADGDLPPSAPRPLPPPPPARLGGAYQIRHEAMPVGAARAAGAPPGVAPRPAKVGGVLLPGAIPNVPHEPRSADPDGGSIDRILVGLDHVRWSVPDAKVAVTSGHSRANFAVAPTAPPSPHTEPRLEPVVFNYPDEKTRVPEPPAAEPVTLPPVPWQGRLKMGAITLAAIAGFVLFGWAVAELWLASPHGRRAGTATASVARAAHSQPISSAPAATAPSVRAAQLHSDEPFPAPQRAASEAANSAGAAASGRAEAPVATRPSYASPESLPLEPPKTTSAARSAVSSRPAAGASTARAAGTSSGAAKNVPSPRNPLYNDLPFHTSSDRTGMP